MSGLRPTPGGGVGTPPPGGVEPGGIGPSTPGGDIGPSIPGGRAGPPPSGGDTGPPSGGEVVAPSGRSGDASPSGNGVESSLLDCAVGPPPDGGGEPVAAGGGGGGAPWNGGGTAPSDSGGNPLRVCGQLRGCGAWPCPWPPSFRARADGDANWEETVAGIRPWASLAGSPGTDARTTNLVSPSTPASTNILAPIAVAVAMAGSRLLRRLNEHPAPPSKYVLRSTRVVAPGASSIGGGDRTNCGDFAVESPLTSSPAHSRRAARHPPPHSLA